MVTNPYHDDTFDASTVNLTAISLVFMQPDQVCCVAAVY